MSGWVPVNPVSQGISHNEAMPGVVVMVSVRAPGPGRGPQPCLIAR